MRKWLRYLWENEDGFFGIGEGPSGTEKTQYGETANLANFATSEGEKDILQSDNFWRAIMSGDPSSISKVLGPEMSRINQGTQQEKKTMSEFGNRGGGTNAAAQRLDTSARTSIDSIIAELTGKGASALGGAGGGLLSTGLSGHTAAFDMSKVIHDQNAAKMNDLFKSIAETASAVFAPGAAAGAKAFGNLSPTQISGGFGGPTSVATEPSPIDTSDWTIQ